MGARAAPRLQNGCSASFLVEGGFASHAPPLDLGHEIQIDDVGAPDGAAIHRTGSVYALQGPTSFPVAPLGVWNTYLIEANGAEIKVTLNGSS